METKLNDGNIIKRINIWEVSLLRCYVTFLEWNYTESEKIDRSPYKLMNMHKVLNPISEGDWLYIQRKREAEG